MSSIPTIEDVIVFAAVLAILTAGTFAAVVAIHPDAYVSVSDGDASIVLCEETIPEPLQNATETTPAEHAPLIPFVDVEGDCVIVGELNLTPGTGEV
ncbi:hypothetical protein C478_07422 [Natrinema thermotolerans DSM 11552]|nr:hypothetical protein C478_07422 [Natrinema thermotolerans DSM 11552]